MSLNKIAIYIQRNTKIEYRKYTINKATSYLKTILLKNVFLKRSVWMAGINRTGCAVTELLSSGLPSVLSHNLCHYHWKQILLEPNSSLQNVLSLVLKIIIILTARGVTKISLRRWVLIFSYMPGIPPKLNTLWRFNVNSVSHFFRHHHIIVV